MPLDDLYQQLILDHNRSPRNFRELSDADGSAEGYNPLCGDRVTVYAQFEDGVITDLSFQGAGCAISTASASLMTERLKGRTLKEANAIFTQFRDMVTDEKATEEATAALGKLAALAGVRAYPSRVKCATLAWHTLQAALSHSDEPVSTE